MTVGADILVDQHRRDPPQLDLPVRPAGQRHQVENRVPRTAATSPAEPAAMRKW